MKNYKKRKKQEGEMWPEGEKANSGRNKRTSRDNLRF